MISEELKDGYFYFKALKMSRYRPTRDGLKGIPTTTAKYAIEQARADIRNGKRRYASSPWGKVFPAMARDRDDKNLVHLSEGHGLRVAIENAGDSFTGRDRHNGYYTDPYQDGSRDGSGLCWGVVFQLPHGKFYPGYQFGGIETAVGTVDFSRAYDTPEDAARPADSMAEHAAEDERDYQTAWEAGRRWADCAVDVSHARTMALDLLRERRAVKGTTGYPAICAAIRDRVAGHVEAISKARAKMEKLAAGDFEGLCFYPDERLTAAFNEGAGR